MQAMLAIMDHSENHNTKREQATTAEVFTQNKREKKGWRVILPKKCNPMPWVYFNKP